MKTKKKKLFMSLNVLIMVFLISTLSLNIVGTKTLLEEKHNPNSIDSFDSSTWNWTITEVVSTESTADSRFPSLAIDAAGTAHVAWEDYTNYAESGTDKDIFYKQWDASSTTWTTTEVVSTESTENSGKPSLAIDSAGNLHVIYQDTTDYLGAGGDSDIFYKRWDASTSSWTTTEVVSTESTGESAYPSLAVDAAGNVHIAWNDWTDYLGAGIDRDIFYKRWDASTSLWTTTEVVSTESTSESSRPSLAVDHLGNVHIAWQDYTNYLESGTEWDIFYKRWDASTSLWTTTEVVSTESTKESSRPSLAVDHLGNVHIAWYDYTNYLGAGIDMDIFYKRWDASTSLWTTTEVASTESTSESSRPSLAVDAAGNVHIAWQDYTIYLESGTDMDIFYKRWDASTSLWTITEVVSTESTSWSYESFLAVDTLGYVHIAWQDYTIYLESGGDWDIFYKLLTSTPATPELAFIVPNPTELTTIHLDWNNIAYSQQYYVYRSDYYIWSVKELVPIATVSSSDYIDTVPSEGFYYYVIVASDGSSNSTHSNCEFVEVKFPELAAPELAPILPNPTDSSSISLAWDSIHGATEYYIYRSTSYIWSVEGLTPLATEFSPSYLDTLPSEGYYFYAIAANDGVKNSTHSNCEYVEYKIPHVKEFSIITGLILGVFVVSLVILKTRKNKLK